MSRYIEVSEEELRFMLTGSYLTKAWRASIEKALAGEGAIFRWLP